MRLFTNALVRTFVDSGNSHRPEGSDGIPDSILVDGGVIVATGSRAELLARPGAVGAEEIDCAGRVILPGFVDAHLHSVGCADALVDLDLSRVRSHAEAVAAIRERAHSLAPGQWVLGAGWDSNIWEVPQQPDRGLLDAAVPQHPVAMWSIDAHTLWVNGRALEAAGIEARTPNPPGGAIVRKAAGEPTGILRESAAEAVVRVIPEPLPDEQVDRLKAAQALFLSEGLTGIHDIDGAAATRAWTTMHDRGLLDIRVVEYLRQEEMAWALETGWRTGGGDEWLIHGGLKLFSDGALGSHTSHMSSHFPNEPENFGIAQMTEDELFARARTATEAGISVAIHAIGDQANHHVLNVFERLQPITLAAEARLGRSLRHRIEHAQFIQAADIARFRELEIIASMQPRHCISDLHLLHLVDESAPLAAYAWLDLAAAGVNLAFGSDGPVEPSNPFAAIYAAMTRANINGDPSTTFQPERRITAAEAIRQHTAGPAYAAGLENRRGVLAAGMDADFIVVDVDPCAADGLAGEGHATTTAGAAGAHTTRGAEGPGRAGLLGYATEQALFAHAEAIRDTTVSLTVVGGEVKHSV